VLRGLNPYRIVDQIQINNSTVSKMISETIFPDITLSLISSESVKVAIRNH